MLLFIAFDNDAAKTHATNLTSFGGVLSKSETLLALTSLSNFLNLLHMVSKVYVYSENFPEFA